MKIRENDNILISMCLLNVPCRYDAETIIDKYGIVQKFKHVNFIPVCPEQLGGLTTPRAPSEIIFGDGTDVIRRRTKVIDISNRDVTSNFMMGAENTLLLAGKYSAEIFIGVAGSPSCSCSKVYDGTFNKALRNGYGVTSALLKCNGITVLEIEDFEKIYKDNFMTDEKL